MKKISVILLLFHFIVVNGQSKLSDTLTTYQNNFYSIQFPKGWTLDTVSSKLSGVDAFLFSEQESAVDSFRENINILHRQLPKGVNTLKQLMDSTKRVIQEYFHFSKFILEEKHHSNGVSYYQLEYPIEQNGFSIHTEQYYFIHGETIFIVTLSMQSGKEHIFKKAGEKIMGSFKIKTA